MKTSTITHERATSMRARLEEVGTPANRLTWAADATTVGGEHRPSPARSLRTATVAFAAAVVLVGCSGAGPALGHRLRPPATAASPPRCRRQPRLPRLWTATTP